MKRILIFCAVALSAVQSFGEFSLGVNLDSKFNNSFSKQNQDNSTNTLTYNLYNFGPVFLISISDQLEINPFFGFHFYRQNTYRNDDRTAFQRNWGYNLGCGAYFRLINGEVFRFSIGPKISYGMTFYPDNTDNLYQFGEIGMPANIDFRLSDRFFIRASPTIFNIGYSLRTTGNEDLYSGDFYWNFITTAAVSIGFFFTF